MYFFGLRDGCSRSICCVIQILSRHCKGCGLCRELKFESRETDSGVSSELKSCDEAFRPRYRRLEQRNMGDTTIQSQHLHYWKSKIRVAYSAHKTRPKDSSGHVSDRKGMFVEQLTSNVRIQYVPCH